MVIKKDYKQITTLLNEGLISTKTYLEVKNAIDAYSIRKKTLTTLKDINKTIKEYLK